MTSRASWGRTTREVARWLVRSAIERDVRPGDRLASESTLIEESGVSRATVREALRLLTFLGATRSKYGPRGGTDIAIPDGSAVASSLTLALQGRRATFQAVLDAYTTFLEAATRVAANRSTPKDLDALEGAVDELQRAQDPRKFAAAIYGFSTNLAAAVHNDAIDIQLTALTRILATAFLEVPLRNRRALLDEYTAVVDAIAAHDGVTASTAIAAANHQLTVTLQRRQRDVLQRWITWPDIDAALEQESAP